MPTYDPTPFGKEIVQSGLTGAGVGTSAMALYYLLNRLRPAELPKTLLQDQSAEKLPTALTPTEKKKKQVKDEALAKTAMGVNDIYASIGSAIPTTFNPFAGNPGSGGPGLESPTIAHAGWRTAANVAALLGGLYGGRKLVNTMESHKKKKQLAQEVEDARRQYFTALTEKESQVLDAVYEQLAEKKADPAGIVQQQVIGPASDFTKNYVGIPLWRALLMTGLGTGALGAHYMYNRTKDTSQSRNLQRAQKARARLKSLQETPWVDPAELEALSTAAK
jgi:hypothetical protein